MASFKYVFHVKKLKRVPVKSILACGGLCILTIIMFSQVVLSPYHSIDKLQEQTIHVDCAYLYDSYNSRGPRMKLILEASEQEFYVWYPPSSYLRFRDVVETDLLSGDVANVTILYSEHQMIRDKLLKQVRVVDIRSSEAVYYDIGVEKIRLVGDYIGLLIGTAGCFAIDLVYLWVLVVDYRLLTKRRVKRRHDSAS